MTGSSIYECDGKQAFPNYDAALKIRSKQAARSRKTGCSSKEQKRNISQIIPYRCTKCHSWHLGKPVNPKDFK